jgi:hypothetical protein
MRVRVLLALTTLTAWWALVSPPAGATAVAEHFCLVLDTPSTLASPTQTAQRNSYVVLQAWEVQRAAQLKAANPNLSILVYQNLSAMASTTGPDGQASTGVSYAEANTAHPEWFLKDTEGHRIAEQGYPWLWMADIGNPGYQQAWTANVLHILQTGPWDGVLMDDTNTTARYHVDPSKIAKYPTDAAYQQAVRSMLAYAGPRITGAGELAIPNMGSWQEYPEVVKEWLQFVSGGMDEMFVKWSSVPGEGYRGPRAWQTQVEEIETTTSMGRRFLAVTQAEPGDRQAVRFGWASVLLGAGGHTAFFAADAYTGDTWSSEYEVPLGEPTDSAYPIGNGVWARAFTNGLVLVNPTSTAQGVSFGGLYSGSGLTGADEATLEPHGALILTRAASKDVTSSSGGESSNGDEAGKSGESAKNGETGNSHEPGDGDTSSKGGESGESADGSGASDGAGGGKTPTGQPEEVGLGSPAGNGISSDGETEPPAPQRPVAYVGRPTPTKAKVKAKPKSVEVRADVSRCRHALTARPSHISASRRVQCKRILRAAVRVKR